MLEKRGHFFNKLWITLTLLITANHFAYARPSTPVVLDGHHLTPNEVVAIARDSAEVVIDKTALERVRRSHEMLLLAARHGQAIYGLTVGVGLNKDQQMVNVEGKLSEAVIQRSKVFNRSLIHAHSAGAGPDMDPVVVRALMVSRLNGILFGATGVQEQVAHLYQLFLNKNIVPVIPSRGSVGEADITLITHVGLAMLGEGEVYYQGKRMPAIQALEQANIRPLEPFGKDALSILSSNAYSEALGALTLVELEHLLAIAKKVFALSIQGLNGNIEPFLTHVQAARPFPGVNAVAADIRKLLAGSYLWEFDEERPLQDPLSYRTAAFTLGTLATSLQEVDKELMVQLNASDDNPGVFLDVAAPSSYPEEMAYYIDTETLDGAVIPTGNFSPLPWVVSFQEVAIALSHVSNASAQRTIKLSDDHFTKLSRFLGTDQTTHAYGAIQKVFVSLATENQELALPVSMHFFSIAGNIEDMATNAPRVIRRLRTMVDNTYYILGLELMHAAQAVDLRLQKKPGLVLSAPSRVFFEAFRSKVSFMEKDRVLTDDIQASYLFLKNYKVSSTHSLQTKENEAKVNSPW